MNLTSVDIKDMLVSANLGVFSTDLFIGREPAENPVNCVTIYDTGGPPQNPKFAIDISDIQIRCRNADYISGYEKLKAIKLYLEGKGKITQNTTTYIGFWANTNIAFLKYDINDRAIWVSNFKIVREPSLSDIGNRRLT